MSYIVPTTIGTRSARAHNSTSNMATSKSFFGMRRGSTKDHTFSTYRGMQVTKSRVTRVANPQTEFQMRQRLHLVQVANAATKLKGLIDHSFEGVAYGQACIGRFRTLNLQKNSLEVVSYVPKDFGDCGVANFMVAKGSLPEIATSFPTADAKSNAQMSLDMAPTEQSFDATLKNWMRLNGLVEGDQLTFLAGFQTGTMLEIHGIEAYSHAFAISRLELKFDADGSLILNKDGVNMDWLSTRTPQEGSQSVKEWSLVNGYFGFKISTDAGGDGTSTLKFTGANYAEKDGYAFDMAAVIHSRLDNGVWRRSLAVMATKVVSDYRITFEEALPSYMKASAAASSNKYLNRGAQKTGIIGNQ